MAVTLNRDDIMAALNELVDVLVAGDASAHIRIVGSAAIALSLTRESTTTDVDALYGSSAEVEEAVREIARRRGWPDDWLNDKVKMFASHFDDPGDWTDFEVRAGVVIRVAGPRLLLAMKLLAARGRRDSGDIDVLLDACGITSVDEAVAVFEHYYRDDELNQRAMAQLAGRFSRGPFGQASSCR